MGENKASSYKENLKKLMEKANISEGENNETDIPKNKQVIQIKNKQEQKKKVAEPKKNDEVQKESQNKETPEKEEDAALLNRLQAIEEYIKSTNQVAATAEPQSKISPKEKINKLIEEIMDDIRKESMPDDNLFDEVKEEELPFIVRKPTFSQPARPAVHEIFDILAESTNKFTKYEIFEKVVIAGVKQYINKNE